MDVILLVIGVLLVISQVVFWSFIFIYVFWKYFTIQKTSVLNCFKVGMQEKPLRVILFYVSNIFVRIVLTVFIALTSVISRDHYPYLWGVIFLLVLGITFIPSPFTDTFVSVMNISINIFTLWIVFTLFYISTEEPTHFSKEAFAKRYILMYTCIMGLISVASILFGIIKGVTLIISCVKKCKLKKNANKIDV